ncbi:MAG: hypothetical protein ACFB9M_13635 [Myxococcota bacterium]
MALLWLCTPCRAGAQMVQTTVHPVVFVESEESRDPVEAFRRIEDARPLELKLEKAGRVFLAVRPLVGSRQEHALRFEIEARPVTEAVIEPTVDENARFVERIPGKRPGLRSSFQIRVEAKEYPARLTVWLTEGREILVSYRYAPLSPDVQTTRSSTAGAQGSSGGVPPSGAGPSAPRSSKPNPPETESSAIDADPSPPEAQSRAELETSSSSGVRLSISAGIRTDRTLPNVGPQFEVGIGGTLTPRMALMGLVGLSLAQSDLRLASSDVTELRNNVQVLSGLFGILLTRTLWGRRSGPNLTAGIGGMGQISRLRRELDDAEQADLGIGGYGLARIIIGLAETRVQPFLAGTGFMGALRSDALADLERLAGFHFDLGFHTTL